ncbi:unnamed protein product [Didymodactylos carnosus]|uniref:Uncharacterized protein n=1 Tax=Didymodactylos carnosus TaxID=1234261 RepID=A0A814X4P4_9BILA|nr:unnamed protein product [Didymodactylos carnosus]CAF1213570.1 unnamed protein product [Didymodactylos carnosus]CAF3976996.1 unnamed protein product [Didymodactylos carnosus]CAF4022374.1 unnamed protein product [Didymodactylos carnosus]
MKSFWNVFLKMTNIHVLKDPKMLIICLANVCSMIGYYTPYLFTTKLAYQLGISEYRAVFLISVIDGQMFTDNGCAAKAMDTLEDRP